MDPILPDSPHRRKSNRKSWIDQSPIDPTTDIAREETLLLTHFTKKPTICFGKVKVGKTLNRKLYVSNPHDYDQCVLIEKFPHDMGFTVDQIEFVVPGESTMSLNIAWTPENEGGCRQMVSFLVDDSYRLQTVLYGTAEVPRQKKVAKRGIMSRSVKTPFSVLHTPNLANLKTYGSSVERETVSKTTNVRRTLPSSKSKYNQENRQPSSKKSSLVTPKSPPRFQKDNSDNRNSCNESGILSISKSESSDLKTKVRSSVKELYHLSRTGVDNPEIISCVAYEDSPEQQKDDFTVPVQEYTTVNECGYTEMMFSKQEHVTEIHAVKINQWKALEEACQIKSQDDIAEIPFDYALCKKQKQNHEQSVAALSPRRETYLVKKHVARQRRSWKNRISSPPVRHTIPEMGNVIQTCASSFVPNVAKPVSASAGVFIPSPNFMTSSPIDNPTLRNKTFQPEKSNESSSIDKNSKHSSGFKEKIEEQSAVRIDQPGKSEVSPKSDDGMSSDSLNSKNSSASSVEALLTGKVDLAPEKAMKSSTTLRYDFHQATPSLPEKPNPRQVRRSTHVVKEPKIVCGQGKLRQKQLFSTGVGSGSNHDVSYVRPIDESKEFPAPKKTQVKTSTTRNSVTSRVRAAQKAVRITNREQLSQSVHEQLSRSQKLEASEKSKSILTQSARSAVRTVKKTEITKSKSKSYLSPKKCGVAQSRLVLGKREKTVIPKHPMPFASKNIYYDDRWMQKQEWSFTHWFNYILTPVEDYKLRNCPRVDAGSLVFNCKKDYHLAPSKEVLSFEAYAARRRLNRLRKLACQMFQSADIVKVVRKVEVEIDSQRLVVRKDRPIHADIGLKQNILNWILSYNPLWLRIGLEMVFGEILLVESNTDVFGLSKFIITRLVGNPDIASQFAHPTVPHLYREGYQAALAKHTLKKFLILVYFLDYAKRHRLIEHDPCLFCKDSEIKASRDFLLNISRDFLSGEGDVTRHLAYLGYVVSYVQTPLDEFDYAVTNLATDLRDGVRLTRVVEILTSKWGLTKMLRAPAISRLQKIHNLEKVLKALSEHGMSLDLEKGKICAKDIVDGHREKTLTLLWRIVTGFQVDILLDIKELEDEITCLNRTLKRKIAIWKSAGVKSSFELNNRRSSVDLNKFENSKHGLLFAWCQAVCSHYGLKIENFTVSFSDGRVLCFLIHHYYPGLLPLSEIRQQTTVTYINECESQQQDSDNSFDGMASTLRCSPRTGKPKIYQELLANEAENFKLIAIKVSKIGGVPTMLRHSDMSNTIPDEKVVITYITYLAIRLLEIRHESRAAIIIQLAWRKYQLRKKQRLLKLKDKSRTPVPNSGKVIRHQPPTPDQSSPLRKQEAISIKNAIIPFAENSDDSHLGHSINDYSPIRPVDMEPLPVSSKKGKVLDTILESSLVEGCVSYNHGSQNLVQPFLIDKEDISLCHKIENIEASNETSIGQKLNKTINLSDGMIRSDERLSNKQTSFQAGEVSPDRPCGDGSAKNDSDNLTDSKRASSQLNKTIDLKDGSLLSKADLPQASADSCNETFNSDRGNQKSTSQIDLPNISNTKIGINETFDEETCLQKLASQATHPVVERKQMHNETFEKICPQMSAVDSTQHQRIGHNETFNNEACPSQRSELLNSSMTKVEGDDVKQNKTFDSELSRPELQNILPRIDTSTIQENEEIAYVTNSGISNLHNLDEIDVNGTFEGKIQESNARMGELVSDQNHQLTTKSVYEEKVHENVSLYEIDGEHALKEQCFHDKQMVSDVEIGEFESNQNQQQTSRSVSEETSYENEVSYEIDGKYYTLEEECFLSKQMVSNAEMREIESKLKQPSTESVSDENVHENESLYEIEREYILKEEYFPGKQMISDTEMREIESKLKRPSTESVSDENVHENESLHEIEREYILKEEYFPGKQMISNTEMGEFESKQNERHTAKSVSEENFYENESVYDTEEYHTQEEEYFHDKQMISNTEMGEFESKQNDQQTAKSVSEENFYENESVYTEEYHTQEEEYFHNKQMISNTEMGEFESKQNEQQTAKSVSEENFYENESVYTEEYHTQEEEYFHDKQMIPNTEMGEFAVDSGHIQSTESVSDENIYENESLNDIDGKYCTPKEEHFHDEQEVQNDECPPSGCKEITDKPVLNQTSEFDNPSQSSSSKRSSIKAKLSDHSQQNMSDGKSQPSEGDEKILDSYDEDSTEYKSEGEDECLSLEEDLFNDSCVCEVQNESVSFCRLNKTMEMENGATPTRLQNSEGSSHVESCLDMQNSLDGTEDENKCDGVIFSASQRQQSVDNEEEWIEEEFTLKMSRDRNRTKEMIADRESLEPSDRQKDYLENKSALMIQNRFRAYAARKRFLSLKKSAIAIQRWYRCTKEMKKAHENYGSLKAATMVIQATVRAYQERKRFLQKKKCILSMQQRRRALVATRCARSEYLAKSAAAKAIQRWYRAVMEMRKIKNNYKRTRNAVVKIQSLVRRKKQRHEFLQKKRAAIFIQKWYHSTREMQEARENYASVRKATIQIQSLFRARKQRKQFMLERKSALEIQKTFRMFSARKHFLDCKNSTIAIQQWYRCARKMKKDRQNYQDIKAATLVIQSAVRSHLVRKTFLKQKQCLVSLQQRRRGLLLMRSNRTEYLAKRAAIKIIQRWYRAVTEMRKAKNDFEKTRKAVIKIQSIARQRLIYREFLTKKNAILHIQEWFRAIKLMKEEKHKYVSLKNAAVHIQAVFRGYRQRKAYLLQRESAMKIQSMFRKFQAQKRYLCYRNSVITIQVWYRSVIEMRKARRDFESLKVATLLIQSTVKGYLERKRFLQKKECVISLQQRRRALVMMRTIRTEYLAKKAASKIIQRWYHAIKEMQKVRCDFEKTRNAVVKIQSLVRMKNQQKQFIKMKESAIGIQKWYRSVRLVQEARESYLSVRKATVQIQALFRARKQRKQFLLKKESALKIQEWYRGICRMQQARIKFLCLKSSTIKIQQAYKAYCLMKADRNDYLLMRSSVIKLQAWTRMLLARRQFFKQKHSAIIIQRWYHSVRRMVEEKNAYQAKKLATVKLQSAFRGYLQRKIFLEKRKYTISIQSVVRMWSTRRKWLVMRSAAVLIQRNYRRRLAQRRLKETVIKRHEAATCIQLWFREKLISWRQNGLLKIDCDCCSASSLMKTKKYADIWLEKTRRKKVNAVCILQKYCRKWLQRRYSAATKIQSIVRGWLVRQRLTQQTSAAIVIQRSLRGWHARITLKKRKQAIIKIQSCLRRYIKRKREATYLLQRVIRGWLVRNRIKKLNHSATLIQSFWKGYKIRCSTRRPITNLRKRLVDVTKKATEDKKLSNRFALGFDHLMKYKQLSEVLQSLVNLEVASRLSPVCCVQLAEGHAAPVIFTIIRGCNRSVPHMELIKYCIQILLNLAKYAPTIEAVYDSHPDAIDIILNVLMVFREKGVIFSKSCILLGIIALDLKEKGNLDELLSKPQFKEKILSLYKLTERKYKREETRVTTRARMCAVKDSAVFCEISMAAELAKIGPDWLLGKKILREIEEPLKAMTYLLNCLNLQPEVQQITHKKSRTSK